MGHNSWYCSREIVSNKGRRLSVSMLNMEANVYSLNFRFFFAQSLQIFHLGFIGSRFCGSLFYQPKLLVVAAEPIEERKS